MITLTDEQARQVREAFYKSLRHFTKTPSTLKDSEARGACHMALAILDAALAQPEHEPVAIADGTFNHDCPIGTPLYAAPVAQPPFATMTFTEQMGATFTGIPAGTTLNPGDTFYLYRAHGIGGKA